MNEAAAFIGHHEAWKRSNLTLLSEHPLRYVEKAIGELLQPGVPKENKDSK